MHTRRRVWASGLLALFLSGCSYVNTQLNDPHLELANRAKNQSRSSVFADVSPPASVPVESAVHGANAVIPAAQTQPGPVDKDGYFIGVALSGGGSRSANFSAACMFHLERIGLMRHVDYISSVSGGSLAAAYYCSSDNSQWNPAQAQKHLTHSFATDLILQSFLPWNTAAFFLTDWDRSDVLAGVFRDQLFSRDGRAFTFADLRADRPRLLMNATDLQTGRRFVFCNETFDDLNSNLSNYPLAYAVAASAAVPVVLHPVTLRDFSTTFPQYRHLIDGGIADNLGMQTLVETYFAQIESAAKAKRPDPYPHGAVFVIINAQTRFNAQLSSMSDVGLLTSLTTSLGLTSHALVNRASSATLAESIIDNAPDNVTAKDLRAHIRQLDHDGFVDVMDRAGHRVQVFYISLSQLEGKPNLPFQSFSQAVNSIDTYFNISDAEAYSLYQAADLLIKGRIETSVSEIVKEIEQGGPATQPAHRE